MIMAQLPAKQDQYVKYAEKDSKGRNIAEKIDEAINTPLMENIVDSDGHKRFQEWNGIPTTSIEGFTPSYCKASLSGTHIMIVMFGSYAASTEIPQYQVLARFKFPEWIYEKLVAITNTIIEFKTVAGRNSDYSQTNIPLQLVKYAEDKEVLIQLSQASTLTLSKAGNLRIQFDFLID